MADFKVGTFSCPAGTGASAVTGVGFAPDALILWATTRTSDGTSPGAMIGLGVATSNVQRFAVGWQGDDGTTQSVYRRGLSDAHCLRLPTNDAGTTGLEADLDSLDADGFTLDWSIVTSGADVHYLAIGGLTGAKVQGHTLWTGTGAQAVTGAGFAPEALIGLYGTQTAAVTGGGDGAMGLTATDGTAELSLSWYGDDANATADSGTYLPTTKLFGLLTATNIVVDGEADFTSLDADGFTVNVSDAYAAAYLAGTLCLAGLSVKAGTLTVPGSTGTQDITGLGFDPEAVLFFGRHASAAGPGGGSAIFLGAASGPTARAVVSSHDTISADPTVADHDSDTTNAIKQLTAGTPTVDYAADLDSFLTGGFRLDWSVTGTGAGTDLVAYVALGDASGGGGGARAQAVWVGL